MVQNFQNIKNDKGQILLLSLVVLIFISLLLGAATMRSSDQAKEVMRRRGLQEAFYAAEAAIDNAVFNLRQNAGWRPDPDAKQTLSVNIGGIPKTVGYYWTNVINQDPNLPPPPGTNGWRSCWITAQGKDTDQKYTRTIQALVIVESPTNFLISTMGPLHIGSSLTFNADTLANDVYFDINPSLSEDDKKINLDGDVYYMNNVTGDKDPADPTKDNPYLNWGKDQAGVKYKVKQSSRITFAGVDLDYYSATAQNLQLTKTGVYKDEASTTIDLAALSNLIQDPPIPFKPQIIYSTGDIHICGVFNDSILIVAAGDIYIEDNIVANPALATAPQIGLFAKGDVIIPESAPSTLSVEGFILADGGGENGTKQGVFTAQGAKFSKDKLNFKGSISVRGKAATAVDLNAFSNRDYNYNPDFKNRRTIPFTPFIVNIIRWQECKNATCT